jgi:hypothetical protein
MKTSNGQLTNLQDNIIFLKNYVLVLEARLLLLRENHSLKSEYEKNEVSILTYETLAKISSTKFRIGKLQLKFEAEYYEFTADIKELEEKFETTLHEAKKQQNMDINLKHYLYSANWNSINNDVSQKISFYKGLKSFLYQS